MQIRKGKALREVVIFVVAALIVVLVVDYVEAGSLNPSADPAPTMNESEEIYDPILGTYDSSSVTASASGNIFQMLKCIENKLAGSTCP